MIANDRPHKRLEAWKKAMELVQCVYRTTSKFPNEESYVLAPQMRRAAVSIPSNLAEGLTRQSEKERCRYVNVAQASLSELDTQIELAKSLGYIKAVDFDNVMSLLVQVERLVGGLMRSLRAR